MLETRTGPGELFTSIVKEQFETIRDSDRFWFENAENQIRYQTKNNFNFYTGS
jgi:dual oxidase